VDGPSGHKPCYVVADGAEGEWRCFVPGARSGDAGVSLRMVMPVSGRISLRFSSATPWISWQIAGTDEITAPAGGRIEAITEGEAGTTLTIRHDEDVTSRLLHLDRVNDGLSVGTKVRAGQVLGVAGGSGDPA